MVRRSLWGIPSDVADRLEHDEVPVLTAWGLFVLIRRTYQRAAREVPPPRAVQKCAFVLERETIIQPDRDYPRHYRVLTVSDRAADDIVCLIDPFCHISCLSAMQRWGLTDRNPRALILSRPPEKDVTALAAGVMDTANEEIPKAQRPSYREAKPFRLNNIVHPSIVRRRPIKLSKSRHAGTSINDRSGFARVSTIGQTFLDTLSRPALCGGMSHVLDVWDSHAAPHLDSIIAAIDSASPIVKCRAGYILEERLGVRDSRLDAWRHCAARGGSRVLDPARPFAPIWSDTWMLSLNANIATNSH